MAGGRSIHVLEDTVINQIAAGEVVERPASVVKELVENSLDAGATNIAVVLTSGGRSRIEVLDNGCGMTRDDALLAVQRFATSKLTTAEDLFAIRTLGFRGEALPSIAAVSRFTLATAQAENKGVEVVIEGGKVMDVVERSLPTGTRIEVRDLFYNVPARRSFLKTERTEAQAVRSLLLDFAAAYPSVRFRFVSDGEESLNLAASEDFAARVRQLKLAGSEPLCCCETARTDRGEYAIEALVTRPIEAARGAARLRLIVNGRCVRDRLLLRAVRDGFGNFLKGDQYPQGVLKLTVPPQAVDVNVHPQKAEVRFREADRVFLMVRRAINGTLGGVEAVPENLLPLRRDSSPWQTQTTVEFIPPRSFADAPCTAMPTADTHRLRYVGQIFQCYLLFEGAEDFVLVDMHAAHERITYSRLVEEYRQGEVKRQLLLVPEVIELSSEELESVRRAEGVLQRIGFDCEVFGDESIIIRALPAILGNCSAREVLSDLLASPEWQDWEGSLERHWESVLARVACHGSVRSGRTLEREEAYALLAALEEAERGAFCPHGRPVLTTLAARDIESLFGRS